MKAGSYELGEFRLQSGEVLQNAHLSYEIHGELNAEKSNAVVYPTWYTGIHEDNRAAIATGKALDPERYFIIVPDMFCNGLSSSPSNTTPPQDRGRFPSITPYDNVIAQHRLCSEQFGLDQLKLVVGYSMSAQQAFHWGALFPDMVRAIAPICGSSKTSPHNWLFLEGVKSALIADASWANGNYVEPPENGLKAFTTVYASWALSQTGYREGVHLTLGGQNFGSMTEFLEFFHGIFARHDANNLLGMLETWQLADVSKHPRFQGDWHAALSSINCPAIVLPSKTDLYFPPEDNAIEVAMMPDAELRIIPSVYGHAAGYPGLSTPEDDEFIDNALHELLSG
jgi:homoserine O-acetyltransferase